MKRGFAPRASERLSFLIKHYFIPLAAASRPRPALRHYIFIFEAERSQRKLAYFELNCSIEEKLVQ